MPRRATPNNATSPPPTDEQAATYDRLVPMLEAAHREMTELSKKKQDGIVNTLKIKMLNRLLSELSKVIEKDPSYAFVDMLDEETLPQNSERSPRSQPMASSPQAVQRSPLRVRLVRAPVVHRGEPQRQGSLTPDPQLSALSPFLIRIPARRGPPLAGSLQAPALLRRRFGWLRPFAQHLASAHADEVDGAAIMSRACGSARRERTSVLVTWTTHLGRLPGCPGGYFARAPSSLSLGTASPRPGAPARIASPLPRGPGVRRDRRITVHGR